MSMKKGTKSIIIAATLAATSVLAPLAQANEFPEKGRTINLIVPYGAGGMVDVVGRSLAAHWDAKWGTRTVVLNKPGANGQIGFAEMFKQPADGYTIAFTHAFDTQMTYLDSQVRSSFSRSDFVPVGLVQSTPALMVVQAESPHKTFQDLINSAKAKPGSLSLGSPATRGPVVLYADQLERQVGAKFNVAPFKDVPSTLNALMGGHIDAALSNTALVKSSAGRVRVVLVIGDKPNKYFPETPTSASIGLPMEDFSNTGMAVKKGTPRAAVKKWSDMLKEISEDSKLRAQLDGIGVTLAYASPSEYEQLWMRAEESVSRVLMQIDGAVRPAK